MKILLSLSEGNGGEWFRRAFSSLEAELCPRYLPRSGEGADALILGGGGDLKPREGEDPSLFIEVDAPRQEREEALAAEFIAQGRAVLGICRGHQLLGCLWGARLVPRLNWEELHRKEGGEKYHCVEQQGDCPLLAEFPRRFPVWSRHHHGICLETGPLQRAAFSADGLCEAFYHPQLPLWGVQWHPERMGGGERLFRAFLRLAKGEREEKRAEP